MTAVSELNRAVSGFVSATAENAWRGKGGGLAMDAKTGETFTSYTIWKANWPNANFKLYSYFVLVVYIRSTFILTKYFCLF